MFEAFTTSELARAFAGFPVVVTDEDHKILAASRPLEIEFGYTVPGSLKKHSVEILFPEKYREKYKSWREHYTRTARIITANINGLRKSGEEFDAIMLLYCEVISGKVLTYAIISEVVDM